MNDDLCSKSTNEKVIEVDKLANMHTKLGVTLQRATDEWTAANELFEAVFGNFHFYHY